MASSIRLSYKKLEKLPKDLEEEEEASKDPREEVVVLRRRRRRRRRRRWWWLRVDNNGGRRLRRPRIRIARFGRLLRRKASVVGAAVRVSVAKAVKRFKEGRPYIGELFAGNYMFMQVTPSPTMGTWEKSFLSNYYHNNQRFNYAPKVAA